MYCIVLLGVVSSDWHGMYCILYFLLRVVCCIYCMVWYLWSRLQQDGTYYIILYFEWYGFVFYMV